MTAPNIHPTAIVADGARLGSGVRIGPYSIVGSNVTLGNNVELVSHAVVEGNTTIGPGTRIFPFASVGPRVILLNERRTSRSDLELGSLISHVNAQDAIASSSLQDATTDAKGGCGSHRRKPCMCSDEQGRTLECTLGLSNMNLGMFSWIEQHGDRQTT